MNNIRKALRYIYIYILTHANAGGAYDRQPREVWRGKTYSENRNDTIVAEKSSLLCRRRRRVPQRIDFRPHSRTPSEHNDCYRQNELHFSHYNGCVLLGRRCIRQIGLPRRRLTSKEVAA